MPESANLLLPFVQAAQAQKHVPVNSAFRLLDGLVQMAVRDADRTAPPAAPAEGDRHVVATGATGGWDGDVAFRADGAWLRLQPRVGWVAWNEANARLLVHDGAGWSPIEDAMGLLVRSETVELAKAALGSSVSVAVEEELLSGLSGASVDTSLAIVPGRAVVLGVSVRVVTEITGATSFDVGVTGETDKFGASLGIAAGSTNAGVIAPTPYYADTPVRLTANGADFAGGAVRVAVHALRIGVPAA